MNMTRWAQTPFHILHFVARVQTDHRFSQTDIKGQSVNPPCPAFDQARVDHVRVCVCVWAETDGMFVRLWSLPLLATSVML